MNKVILMGRLTRDPEVRYSQGDASTAVARFSLAVDRRFKRDGDDQSADFINCVAFGRTGEFFERFGRKGTKFVVEGRIQTGSYTNKEGQRVYTTDVTVDKFRFVDSLKKQATQLVLKLFYLKGYGGLGIPKMLGGFGKAPKLCDMSKCNQISKLHDIPSKHRKDR